MALELQRNTIATHNLTSPVGVEVVKERTGSNRGERVKASLENSKASEAAKSVKPSALERANLKSLNTRVMRQGQAASAEGTSRIAEYRDKVPEYLQDEAVLVNLVQSFQNIAEAAAPAVEHHVAAHVGARSQERETDRRARDGGEGAEAESSERGTLLEQVFDQLEQFDKDPGRQRGALTFLRDYFSGEHADSRFHDLLQQAEGVFQSAATLETDPQTVRDAYRELLRNRFNIGEMFDKLTKFDLANNFSAAIDTFVQAAGADLRATGPNTDKTFLEALLNELNNLHKMRTVLENSGRAIRNMKAMVSPEDLGKLEAARVTSQVLHFSGKPTVGFDDVKQLFGAADSFPPSGKVSFANELRGVLADCPDTLFPSPEIRLKQGQVFTLFVDQLVAQEEQHHQQRMAG